MVPRKQGLIVTISSFGGLTYFGNVPYGIGKAAVSSFLFDRNLNILLKRNS
jgi:dehydrogenase/reductase SDR family protein 1